MGTLNRTWPSITRLIAIVAIVIALALGFNLGRQATVVYRLRREEARLQEAVAEEKARAAALEARKAYILNDTFVEEWARTVAKLTHPGEVRVVGVVQEPADFVQPDLGKQRFQWKEAVPYWERWWELFFGPVDQNGFD